MIDKEKVRDICRLYWDAKEGTEDELITKWLEQNHPEPVVVGLSDYQIRELAIELEFETTDDCERDEFEVIIKNWLKNQTFAQPNKSFINRGESNV